jgi:hypothetical protein
MRRYAELSLASAVLLFSLPLWPQVYRVQRPDVFARLSYRAVQDRGLRHTCIALSQDGNYRMEEFWNPDQTPQLFSAIPPDSAVQGRIPEKQFQQLRTLLSDSDFRHVVGSHPGVIRQSAEAFGAEIIRDDGTQRLQWLNPDGENPFPSSVAKVVGWLKRFEPTDATPFEYVQFPDVCPTGGLRLLHPSVARNFHP